MARQLRIEYEGAFYHVTSRGNQRGKVFFQSKDMEKFLEILGRTKERYGYNLHAYTLMDNHYHLLLETPKANISQIMQNINTSYTVYINKKYRRSGHLFQGRFKGIIVDKDEYLITLSRYIHLNPVRAKIVQKLEDYKWTSYKAFIGIGKNALVDTTDTLSYFSEEKRKASKAYKGFVESGIGGKEEPFNEVEVGMILGGKTFKAKILKLLDKTEAHEELPQINKFRGKIPIDEVIEACCSYYGKDQKELVKRGKGKSERQIAIYLSKVLSGKKNSEVGKYFGIKGPAVSGVIKTIEDMIEKEGRFKQEVGKLKGLIDK